ncbi:hypothetical protein [Sorangium sp. So ce1078]|uniref:hypothetical protein n=1 Tax=Sorangium sp. So ce1078 TaxID=3133329 RepID=UPI003F6175D5
MGARDDDDIRKYMPDLKTIARTADPALAEERYREALNNPELDRALDELKQGAEPGRAPFEFPVVVAPPKQAETPAPGPAAQAAAVAPAPAAATAAGQAGGDPPGAGAARFDAAAPGRPAAAPPPAAAPEPARDVAPPLREGRRGMSRRLIVVLLAVAVLGPLATQQIFSRLGRAETPAAAAAPVAPPEARTAPVPPSAEVPPARAGASAEAPPARAGASAEVPPARAGASAEAPPARAGATARPEVPAARAPSAERPAAGAVPAPPEIAPDIMH